MNDEIKMLDAISEAADMGRDSLNHVIGKSGNVRLTDALQKQYLQYDSAYEAAERMLRSKGKKPQKTGPAIKAYAHIVSNIQTAAAANESSKIAEMVINGSAMGVTKVTKQLNGYRGGDQAVEALARQLIEMEQANIEEMKKYL